MSTAMLKALVVLLYIAAFSAAVTMTPIGSYGVAASLGFGAFLVLGYYVTFWKFWNS
jgi:RsiW-degrading membrane proteinase PrsW (M82 family)